MGLAFMAVMELALQYFRSRQRCRRRWFRSLRPVRSPFGLPMVVDLSLLLANYYDTVYVRNTVEINWERNRKGMREMTKL